MTPPILWRESFGYGFADLNQIYLQIGRDNSIAVLPTSFDQLLQWGRGSGGDQGFALRGNPQGGIALRVSTLGFAGAVASGIGTAFAYNQGGNVGNSILAEFWDNDGVGDGSFSRPGRHLSIETLADGTLCARNGNGGTILGTSSYILGVGSNSSSGPWTHIEILNVVISGSVGSVQVYADGVKVLDLSNVNTRNGGAGKIGYLQIGQSNSGGRLVTDWVVTDGSSRIGDCRVSYRPAAVAGTYTAGTATGAGTLLACVQETVMDGDTTYINFDNTSLPKAASFTTTAMPSDVVSIIEVSPLVIRRKDDAGADTDRAILRSSSTEVDGGVDLAVPSGYTRSSGVGPALAYILDPHTGVAWTTTNCDNVEIGDRRTA